MTLKNKITFFVIPLLVATANLVSCNRYVRVAEDVTPGNCSRVKLDWRYGAGDIQIQTTKVLGSLMDRWLISTGWICQGQRPRIVITEIENKTDCYISMDMIRDIFEGVAVTDGRFTVVVGNRENERELDHFMDKITCDPKYSASSRVKEGQATAPQFLAKVRLTKAKTEQPRYTLEDYRMTITLYDIETQEIIDSYWDVLSKRVFR